MSSSLPPVTPTQSLVQVLNSAARRISLKASVGETMPATPLESAPSIPSTGKLPSPLVTPQSLARHWQLTEPQSLIGYIVKQGLTSVNKLPPHINQALFSFKQISTVQASTEQTALTQTAQGGSLAKSSMRWLLVEITDKRPVQAPNLSLPSAEASKKQGFQLLVVMAEPPAVVTAARTSAINQNPILPHPARSDAKLAGPLNLVLSPTGTLSQLHPGEGVTLAAPAPVASQQPAVMQALATLRSRLAASLTTAPLANTPTSNMAAPPESPGFNHLELGILVDAMRGPHLGRDPTQTMPNSLYKALVQSLPTELTSVARGEFAETSPETARALATWVTTGLMTGQIAERQEALLLVLRLLQPRADQLNKPLAKAPASWVLPLQEWLQEAICHESLQQADNLEKSLNGEPLAPFEQSTLLQSPAGDLPIRLRWEQPPDDSSTKMAERESYKAGWTLQLTLNLNRTQTFTADIRWQDEKLHIVLWSQDDHLDNAIAAKLPDLANALRQSGFEPWQLQHQKGESPLFSATPAQMAEIARPLLIYGTSGPVQPASGFSAKV
jgi:hypothetical protein